jgi:hypothetical protein
MEQIKRIGVALAVVGILLGNASGAWTDGLTVDQINTLNRMYSAAKKVGLGTKLNQALTTGAATVPDITLSFPWIGVLGHDVGPGSDGVLVGELTPQAVGYAFLYSQAIESAVLATACDGGAYTAEGTEANNATADDVTLVPATAVAADAYYIGHATRTFNRADITITTAGTFSGTVVWEYWDGTAYTSLAGVTDGTSNFSAAPATVSVTFTVPTDWAKNTVHGTNGYWIRGRISVAISGGGALAGRVRLVAVAGTYTDDTADCNSAGAGDLEMLPAYPVVGDALYLGKSSKFAKVKTTISTARANGTMAWQYYTGSTWATLTTADNSATWSAGTSTYVTSFMPPSDWTTATVNSQSAYWVRCILTVTGVTVSPVGTRAYLYDFTHGSGIKLNNAVTFTRAQMRGQTASGTAADTKLLLVNLTKGTFDDITWTKADVTDTDTISLAFAADEELVLTQCIEDGSTEFANVQVLLDE